jgi:anhydro-N-acetylmuramic acid kinase
MTDHYVGLISGTSMDGIDAVVVSFGDASVAIHGTHAQPYSDELRDALLTAIREPLHVELDESGELNRQVGESFSAAAKSVIENSGVDHASIVAIGSHGQTLRHQPDAVPPFSIQIGDPAIIASGNNLTTVANFRQADIEAGGQGAPLVPPFHEWLFASGESDRVVVNIGGIANITVLSATGAATSGFDTGPGNGLMDAWISQHSGQPFDRDGQWAAGGSIIDTLLRQFLDDPYFGLAPPKSTGFEYFNPTWIRRSNVDQFAPADVQATLCELSATTIANCIQDCANDAREVFVCGGGAHNTELMRRLGEHLPDAVVSSTTPVGLNPDWVEAVAFAWLARQTVNGETGNLPSVTGASHKVVLGDIHSPRP